MFFPNSNFVCKIRILFELRLGLWYSEFVLTLTVRPQYFIQHGFHMMVLNFGGRLHLSFLLIARLYSAPTKTATTSMYYLLYALPIFTSQIRIPNVCRSNSNSNFKTEVWKFELRLTSLDVTYSKRWAKLSELFL